MLDMEVRGKFVHAENRKQGTMLWFKLTEVKIAGLGWLPADHPSVFANMGKGYDPESPWAAWDSEITITTEFSV